MMSASYTIQSLFDDLLMLIRRVDENRVLSLAKQMIQYVPSGVPSIGKLAQTIIELFNIFVSKELRLIEISEQVCEQAYFEVGHKLLARIAQAFEHHKTLQQLAERCEGQGDDTAIQHLNIFIAAGGASRSGGG